MNCPLCTKPMKFHFRTMLTEGIRGYTETLSCTSCNCVLDLKVMANDNLHETLNDERN